MNASVIVRVCEDTGRVLGSCAGVDVSALRLAPREKFGGLNVHLDGNPALVLHGVQKLLNSFCEGVWGVSGSVDTLTAYFRVTSE